MKEQLVFPWFNTNATEEPELSKRQSQAISQSQLIHNLYKRYERMSASQVHHHTIAMGFAWPVTSVRRAITNLASAGILRRTDRTVKSPHGANERIYQLIG